MTPAEHWLLHLLPDQGELALDIGANEGAFTLLLAARFQEVHAFEPNPQITPTLRERASLYDNVRVLELAVYQRPGILELALYPGSEHASIYPEDRGPPDQEILVPATSLDLLGYPEHPFRVGFVKVDTEGAEVDVLAGAEQTIRSHRPELLLEIHTLPNLESARALLAAWGYQVDHIPHPHPGVHPGHCWLAATAVAVPAQKGA